MKEFRLQPKILFGEDSLDYLKTLDQRKPVILCGDLNVAHQEIDLKNPKTNVANCSDPLYPTLTSAK